MTRTKRPGSMRRVVERQHVHTTAATHRRMIRERLECGHDGLTYYEDDPLAPAPDRRCYKGACAQGEGEPTP